MREARAGSRKGPVSSRPPAAISCLPASYLSVAGWLPAFCQPVTTSLSSAAASQSPVSVRLFLCLLFRLFAHLPAFCQPVFHQRSAIPRTACSSARLFPAGSSDVCPSLGARQAAGLFPPPQSRRASLFQIIIKTSPPYSRILLDSESDPFRIMWLPTNKTPDERPKISICKGLSDPQRKGLQACGAAGRKPWGNQTRRGKS